MKVLMHGVSNIGRVRKNNEDSIFFDEGLGLSIVCDGIGGREGGEIASLLAVDTMKAEIKTWRARKETLEPQLRAAAQKTNSLIQVKGIENSKLEGMGTTMECALFHDSHLYLAHVGDSRTYLFYKDQLWQISIDHNVQTLVKYGDLPPETLKMINKDSLVKALGVSSVVDIDIYKIKLMPGQFFLSATDGLFDMVEDKIILQTMKTHLTNKARMTENLVDFACKGGGVDNISMVVSEIR